MTTRKPSVYNIPASLSFADTLAAGIFDMAGGDPVALSQYLVLLPSRRAGRTLRDAFLRLSGGTAALLPRMQPLGDVDADEVSLLLSAGDADTHAAFLDIPPAISRLERQILLARLVMRQNGTDQPLSFDQAAALALELGAFLDEVQTENISFDRLKNLVPEKFSAHWQQTLAFLQILTEHWPAILQSRGVIDFADRRNRLLQAQASAWDMHPPQHPVIAAGSTGTVPAARDLLSCVARLPRGMVVLPGFDTEMDAESRDSMGEDHPQYNMMKLLAAMGADIADIKNFSAKPVNVPRVRLLAETMRPAKTTEQWRRLTPDDIPPQALDGLTRIDCDTPQEEADVIALILRHTLETPAKTAALITPDRRLARRVALSLQRWGIQIDDSGGQPLTETALGAWLMLTAEMAEEQLAPVTLLAMLKHPVMAAQMKPEDLRDMVYLLDRLVLRGPRPSAGIAGLRAAVAALDDDKHMRAKKNLTAFIDDVAVHIADFTAVMARREETDFATILQKHLQMAESLAGLTDMTGAARLWQLEQGEAAARFLGELKQAAADIPPLAPAQYLSLVSTLFKSVTVRPHFGSHPRLGILGQIEARLYTADLVILGGLNEGTWPALPAHDPWMSRPMRRDFGLPAPEKSISLAAHDFVQAAAAPEVIITRARKVDGTPTVPARWLLRMETVLQAVGMKMPDKHARNYRMWRQLMDVPPHPPAPVARPAPCPPVDARPQSLSVTRIETWMRDPYQIYAEKILGLRAFDPIDADPGGAERGNFIHAALEQFVKAFPRDIPDDAVEHMLAFGRQAIEDMAVPDEVIAFWWPRFETIATHFVRQERDWRTMATPYATETSGKLDMGDFTLTGKADRIDRLADGSYVVIDYKSGAAPKKADVQQGISPQLSLEAHMLAQNAFPDIPANDTSQLMYWRVTGSSQKPVEQVMVCGDKGPDAMTLAVEAARGLRDLIEAFKDPATPYLSEPRATAKPKFSDYAHLARVREWGLSAEDDGDDA